METRRRKEDKQKIENARQLIGSKKRLTGEKPTYCTQRNNPKQQLHSRMEILRKRLGPSKPKM